MNNLTQWQSEISNLTSAEKIVSWAVENFKVENIILASSLGLEDQVLTHMILKSSPKARILSLDTGRLFQETYDVMNETKKKVQLSI